MLSFRKTIRLFLVDGTTNGLTTAELSNWTGIGVKLPRIKVKEYLGRAEFQKPAVYILVGKDENNDDAAYIGEAEIVGDRLTHHLANRDFWNEVIFFGSKDKYLNKASVRYLENRLHELALSAGRYKLNQNIPTKSELSEAEQAELEEFLAHIKILTASLGHRIFESLEETLEPDKPESHLFFCKSTAGASGAGRPSTEGFLVFKDSLLIAKEQASLWPSLRLERKEMQQNGTLVQEGTLYRLTKNVIFSSSSRAAGMILARSASGPLEWKTQEGIQLKYVEQ